LGGYSKLESGSLLEWAKRYSERRSRKALVNQKDEFVFCDQLHVDGRRTTKGKKYISRKKKKKRGTARGASGQPLNWTRTLSSKAPGPRGWNKENCQKGGGQPGHTQQGVDHQKRGDIRDDH